MRESGVGGVGRWREGARLFGGLDVFAGPGFGRGGLVEALADLFIGFGGAVVGIERESLIELGNGGGEVTGGVEVPTFFEDLDYLALGFG